MSMSEITGAAGGALEFPMEPIEDGGVIESDAESYYSEDSATLGDRVAAARQQAGLTQSGLASRLGVSKKVVSGWENDRTEPRANRLQMLAGMLNVSVAWLLTGAGEGVAEPGAEEPELSRATFALAATDADEAQRFFGELLGRPLERSSDDVLVFEFFGHNARVRLTGAVEPQKLTIVDVDGVPTPFPHLSLALPWQTWRSLAERLRAAGAEFRFEPTIRAVGSEDEYGIFFLDGPGGICLAFSASGQ